MDSKEAASVFRELADREEDSVDSVLPTDPIQRFLIFTEATRVLDYQTIMQPFLSEEKRLKVPDLNLLTSGWNQVAAKCLSPLDVSGGFPIRKSTDETRNYAAALLHQLGRSVLMRRVADMASAGFLSAKTTEDGYNVVREKFTSSQLLDQMDYAEFHEIVAGKYKTTHSDWTMVDYDRSKHLDGVTGAFMSRDDGNHELSKLKHGKVNSIMQPLIRPWDSGYGIMMAYDADPEVDDHFLAEASIYVNRCRNDAGIHPSIAVGETSGVDLIALTAVIVSLHLKHIRFALLASQLYPEICIPQSLTIWGPIADLKASITEWMGVSSQQASDAIDAITIRATDARLLENETSPLIPLLIDLGNGMLIRPVASLARNPFAAITRTLVERDARARHEIMRPREEWLRDQLYAMFRGSRYAVVEGNVKLRSGSKILTDIDAAILDRTTGELALFQIKWQDFSTDDVRALRSRTRNLVHEVEAWAEKVGKWFILQNAATIANTFRLSPKQHGPVLKMFLFAISHRVANVGGFGNPLTREDVVLGNWPQFVRLRHEVGPAENVFDQLHQQVAAEAGRSISPSAVPHELIVADTKINFKDFWVEMGC